MRGCRPFTDDEVQRLLNHFKKNGGTYKNRDRAWFALGISTGFRITELMSLRIKDCSNNYKAIPLASARAHTTKGTSSRRQTAKEKKVNREGRTQLVESWAMEILQYWLDELKERNVPTKWHCFQSCTKEDKPLSRQASYSILIQACSECKIWGAMGTHSMRKTFADRMYRYRLTQFQNGQLLEDPAKMARKDTGHKSQESFEKYLSFQHLNREEVFSFEP